MKIGQVFILIIIFIFRRESKSCSCERNFLRPIDVVYDFSVNKLDQLMINYDRYFLRSAIKLMSKLVLFVRVCKPLFFFSCTNEDRIFFICTGNLNNFLWVKFYFSFLCLVLLVIRQWLGHKKGTFIRCFVIHLRKTYSELFFSCLLRIRMCCTEIWCNRTNKLGNYGGFNASRLFHLNFL